MKYSEIPCLFMGLLALTSASKIPWQSKWHSNDNSIKNGLRPTDFMSVSELESLPSMDEVTVNRLEQMSVHDGAEWMRKAYHLSQAGRAFEASYAPKASEIPCYYINTDKTKVEFKLNELPKIARQEKHFGSDEVTFYITGLPEKSETIKKANRKLVEAYHQRYRGLDPRSRNMKSEDEISGESSQRSSGESKQRSTEEDNMSKNSMKPSGTFVVIEMGKVLADIRKFLTLDVEETGREIGTVLVQWTDMAEVPHEVLHVIGSNMGAHVAGAIGRAFARQTGHQLRRITGLDPSKIYSQTDKALRGLARGDAEFVDVIHTSAKGMGTPTRCGDADFYPNGLSEGVPGADNVIEASMRAVRYFAETVVPGNERNFPAVTANSLRELKENNRDVTQAYMGINTDFDVKGDFMLQVNSKSPFGRKSSARKN